MSPADRSATSFEVFATNLMSQLDRRIRLQRTRGTDVVIDVGANVGQYALALRAGGYKGRIVSFEPMSHSFDVLERQASTDLLWEVRQLALGGRNARLTLHRAKDSVASSLLPFDAAALRTHTHYTSDELSDGAEAVDVAPLASIWESAAGAAERPYLKIDVEGFELEVLRGAESVLNDIDVVEVELWFLPVHANGARFVDVARYLEERGFALCSVEGKSDDPHTGRMFGADAIFLNDGTAAARPRRPPAGSSEK